MTQAGSCDLPFNNLPLSRGPVGTRGWSLSQATASRKSLARASRDPCSRGAPRPPTRLPWAGLTLLGSSCAVTTLDPP